MLNSHEVANQYRTSNYRYASGEWTHDGVDMTFQGCGAGNDPIDTLTAAERVARRLQENVLHAGLPFQWLLNVRILVDEHDYKTCTTKQDTFAIVYIPYRVTIDGQGTFENSGSAFGIKAVRIGSGGSADALVDKWAREKGCICETHINTGRIIHKITCTHKAEEANA